MVQPDLTKLSDHELANLIRELERRVIAQEVHIEPSEAQRKRTIKLLRGTLLTAGGLFAASFEPLIIVLTFVGLWDWIDAIKDDADAMNKRLKLQRTLTELENDLNAAETELKRRYPDHMKRD